MVDDVAAGYGVVTAGDGLIDAIFPILHIVHLVACRPHGRAAGRAGLVGDLQVVPELRAHERTFQVHFRDADAPGVVIVVGRDPQPVMAVGGGVGEMILVVRRGPVGDVGLRVQFGPLGAVVRPLERPRLRGQRQVARPGREAAAGDDLGRACETVADANPKPGPGTAGLGRNTFVMNRAIQYGVPRIQFIGEASPGF